MSLLASSYASAVEVEIEIEPPAALLTLITLKMPDLSLVLITPRGRGGLLISRITEGKLQSTASWKIMKTFMESRNAEKKFQSLISNSSLT